MFAMPRARQENRRADAPWRSRIPWRPHPMCRLGVPSRRWAALILVIALAASCVSYRPRPLDSASFRARGQTKVQESIRVTVAVPSDDEAESLFGVPLAKSGIQPVWLR